MIGAGGTIRVTVTDVVDDPGDCEADCDPDDESDSGSSDTPGLSGCGECGPSSYYSEPGDSSPA